MTGESWLTKGTLKTLSGSCLLTLRRLIATGHQGMTAQEPVPNALSFSGPLDTQITHTAKKIDKYLGSASPEAPGDIQIGSTTLERHSYEVISIT